MQTLCLKAALWIYKILLLDICLRPMSGDVYISEKRELLRDPMAEFDQYDVGNRYPNYK